MDSSAEHLVGAHIRAGRAPASLLHPLAASESVWERRIAILAMFHFIRGGKFELPLRLLSGTLNDPHPLIHEAAGWMLRGIGKRDQAQLTTFLSAHAPRDAPHDAAICDRAFAGGGAAQLPRHALKI